MTKREATNINIITDDMYFYETMPVRKTDGVIIEYKGEKDSFWNVLKEISPEKGQMFRIRVIKRGNIAIPVEE